MLFRFGRHPLKPRGQKGHHVWCKQRGKILGAKLTPIIAPQLPRHKTIQAYAIIVRRTISQ